ncbi:MAG: DUF4834 domain-containing protein [Flavobacteriaceae bacterium]
MAILKTILILVLIYYLLKILARWFGPKLFSYAAKRAEKHFQETFSSFPGQEFGQEDYVRNKNNQQRKAPKKASDDIGEYIDFEEIE